MILNEIKFGVDDTGIKPGIIGEIGLDKSWVEGDEERVLRAAARAQIESGLAITTHTPCSSSMKFFELFKEDLLKLFAKDGFFNLISFNFPKMFVILLFN